MKCVYIALGTHNKFIRAFSTNEKAELFCNKHNAKWMYHPIPELRSVLTIQKEKLDY